MMTGVSFPNDWHPRTIGAAGILVAVDGSGVPDRTTFGMKGGCQRHDVGGFRMVGTCSEERITKRLEIALVDVAARSEASN